MMQEAIKVITEILGIIAVLSSFSIIVTLLISESKFSIKQSTEVNIKEPQIKMISFPLIHKVLTEFVQDVDPENKIRTIKTWQPELFKSLGYINQNGWFINDIITVCLMIFKRHGWIMSYSDIAEIILEYDDMSGKEQQIECNKVREWQPLLWASLQNLIKKEVGPAALLSIILEIFRQWEMNDL